MSSPQTQPGVLISVSRDVAIPLVNQIHDQVVAAIADGDLKAGDRLPTIRELAQFLGINRNTVSQAYRLLESSGQVRTRAGAGTTVIGVPPTAAPARQHELRSMVAAALRQATQHGFTAQEFGQLAYYEARRWGCMPRIVVLVVHGYARELDFLREALISQYSAVEARAVLLDDLPDRIADAESSAMSEIDFAVVPVRLLERATALLAGTAFPILGAGIGPSLATLVQVAKETADGPKRVAVVCSEPAGAVSMEEGLRSAGVITGEIRHVDVNNRALRKTVAWADLILVSDASVEAVAELRSGKRTIQFATMINDSSLATVRSYIDHVIQVKCRTQQNP